MGVKLVMEEKDGKVVLGVSKENCDPLIETFDGYIEDAFPTAHCLLEKAEVQWNTAPRFPSYQPPKQEKAEMKKPKKETKAKKNVTKNIPDETKHDKSVTKSMASETKAEVPANLAGSVTPELPLLARDNKQGRKCRVCGCTEQNACEGGCSWVEEDLCSSCKEKDKKKPGLYLKDGQGPFQTVQEALDAYGAPKDTRPQHNRYDRLSKAWQQIIIRKV